MTATSTLAWHQVAWRYARAPVIGYLLISGAVATFQRSFLYHPHKATVEELAPPQPSIGGITAKTQDGLTLHGWHYVASGERSGRPLSEAKRVVLFFCGNAENRANRWYECDMLTKLGCDVVIFDYRGFGDNEGSPSEAGFALDAEAAWRELVENQKVKHERIVIYGESLGGAISTRLAQAKCKEGTPPSGLVLRSTFASMTETAGHHMWFLPVSMLLIDRYPSDRRIGDVTCPILQFHGDVDQIVPSRMGRRLHEATPEKAANGTPKKFVMVTGADHNDLLEVAGGGYVKEVKAFLEKLD